MDAEREFVAEMVDGAKAIPEADWSACIAGSDGQANPFLLRAFYVALEGSGSAVPATGWHPRHVVLRHTDGQIAGLMPCYAKTHSQGEYVFDFGWADAFERSGGKYYPKLQISVPFTPVTTPKLLVPGATDIQAQKALLGAAEQIATRGNLSSIHATFLPEPEHDLAVERGWLSRIDRQFHWNNNGFCSFDDFLGTLSSRKRKSIRRERRLALSDGISIDWLTGSDITEEHWDRFFAFYMDTGSRKWGQPYLTRQFFSQLGQDLGDRVVLILAKRGDHPVAGALNLVGADAIYGRYWGCGEDVPYLHFEVCYYQAIDYAIAHKLARVEAGAQGEHKLARGYVPHLTRSAHWIGHAGLRAGVADYLEGEREAILAEREWLTKLGPFRRDDNR
ncbi:MAG: N-acetyltransferase [Alphaproteobacteria bacterium]|nr:N-acetyltransferase [Alphaproteobacteria bacterium]